MYSFGRKSGLPLQPRFRTVRHVQKGGAEFVVVLYGFVALLLLNIGCSSEVFTGIDIIDIDIDIWTDILICR